MGRNYTSWAFSSQVRSAGLVQSVGTAGDAYDNVMVESLWGRMQTELLNTKKVVNQARTIDGHV